VRRVFAIELVILERIGGPLLDTGMKKASERMGESRGGSFPRRPRLSAAHKNQEMNRFARRRLDSLIRRAG